MFHMKTRFILFAGALALAFLAVAAKPTAQPGYDLSGGFLAKGTNPDDGSEYTGEVNITRTGDTYKVIWEVGVVYAGTGIILGDTFSVAYIDEKAEYVGIVAYKILKNGDLLEGKWSPLGGEELGTETLTRQ